MRKPERIDNFIEKVDFHILSLRWNIIFPELVYEILDDTSYIGDIDIIQYWKENYDQRFGQVLINLGLIADSLQAWNDEEDDILEAQGLPPEEYLLWTALYDKDKNLLDEPVTKLVKDLNTDHIEAILTHFEPRLSPAYITAFNNTLNEKRTNAEIAAEIQ